MLGVSSRREQESMEATKLKIVLVYIAAATALAIAASARIEQWRHPSLLAGLTPMRLPLKASSGSEVHAAFQATWNEPHYVALVFTAATDYPDIDRTISLAEQALLSREDAPVFDIQWRAVEGSTVIGQGSGHQKPAAVIGGGSRRGLVLGQFPARAGRLYQVEASLGPDFERCFSASPVLEVGVFSATPSVGPAWGRDLSAPVAYCFGLVGVVFLVFGIVLSTRKQNDGRT